MTAIADYFEKNRYVYLSNVIDEQTCKNLTDRMFGLHRAGNLEKDPQCPLSDSVYGDPVFDKLLEELTETLSKQLGVSLDPAYTYARIYRPGEVLERHSDRPSCEISGTMTLGFEPNTSVWPIYFAKDEEDLVGLPLFINTGDLVMYRGNELPHWRPPFKGVWQVQVFFHYVDKNGPYKDHKFDGRKQLGSKKEAASSGNKIFTQPNGYMISKCDSISPGPITFHTGFNPAMTFTEEECKKIISLSDTLYSSKATVGFENNGKLDTSVRSVNKFEIALEDTSNHWIFDRIGKAVAEANANYFKFDLLGMIHGIELLQYKAEENGHYDWHVDIGPETASSRKISVSIPLTNRDGYSGGELELNNGTLIKCIDEQGSITMFPSYMLHRVSPITYGERWVMVIWIHGSGRFK